MPVRSRFGGLDAKLAIAWHHLKARRTSTVTAQLPHRVAAVVLAREAENERLIGWVQLGVIATFALLYVVSPHPVDAPMAMLAPVPIALVAYLAFTVARLGIAYRGDLPSWLLGASILADILLLLGLIWTFHLQYGQPPAFSLKLPTFTYVFVFIALRALRFDFRYVLTAGIAAAAGWTLIVLLAVHNSPHGTITRSLVSYATGQGILIGAEFDKIYSILMVTLVLTLAVRRGQRVLVTAIREEAAGREVRRFLSRGVADVIARSDAIIEAGQAIERDAAILMLDIRGFTRFSMTVDPKVVVAMLTSFHSRILPLIGSHGGVVDKFLGDGVMATFGAVTHSPTAAADVVLALDAIMAEAEAWRRSLTDIGIADKLDVNGAAVAGRVLFVALGHDDRLEYTVIGDAVNLAAKLEKQNKTEKTRALVSAETYEMALAQGYRPTRVLNRRPNILVAGTTVPIDLVTLAE